jgi:hypothetical protein
MPGNLWMDSIILSSVILGSVLPDIHMKKPSRTRLLTAAYYISRFSERACMPVMKFLFRNLFHIPLADRDKRAAHSLTGLVFIFTTIAGGVGISRFIAGNLIPMADAETFLTGIGLGIVFHMIADMCTKKGITPFFPFSMIQIAGSIRPCNPEDLRIAWYHTGLCLVLILMVAVTGSGRYPETSRELIALLGLSLCLGSMLYFSQTRMKKAETGIEVTTDVPGTAT